MKSENFKILKNKINILNDLNDKINLIEWNKDDGPKFESVEEMKEFEKKVINGDFEFVLDDNTDTDNNTILKDYKTTKDNYFFYIYHKIIPLPFYCIRLPLVPGLFGNLLPFKPGTSGNFYLFISIFYISPRVLAHII